MARTRTNEIDRAIKELTDAIENKNPREDPDDFADFARVVAYWASGEHQPFLSLWQKLGLQRGDLGLWSSGAAMPTPRRRARTVTAVEEWLEWVKKEYPAP